MKWKSLHNVCATFVCCKLVAVKVVIVVVVVVKATNSKYNIEGAKQQKHRLGPRQMLQAKMRERKIKKNTEKQLE